MENERLALAAIGQMARDAARHQCRLNPVPTRNESTFIEGAAFGAKWLEETLREIGLAMANQRSPKPAGKAQPDGAGQKP